MISSLCWLSIRGDHNFFDGQALWAFYPIFSFKTHDKVNRTGSNYFFFRCLAVLRHYAIPIPWQDVRVRFIEFSLDVARKTLHIARFQHAVQKEWIPIFAQKKMLQFLVSGFNFWFRCCLVSMKSNKNQLGAYVLHCFCCWKSHSSKKLKNKKTLFLLHFFFLQSFLRKFFYLWSSNW